MTSSCTPSHHPIDIVKAHESDCCHHDRSEHVQILVGVEQATASLTSESFVNHVHISSGDPRSLSAEGLIRLAKSSTPGCPARSCRKVELAYAESVKDDKNDKYDSGCRQRSPFVVEQRH